MNTTHDNKIYKFIAVIFALSMIMALFSCSPKIPPTTTHDHDSSTTLWIDTSISNTTDSHLIAPVIVYDTINFSTFCDSLLKGLMPTIVTERVVIRTDRKGLALLQAKTDSLIQFTHFQQSIITKLQNTVVSDSVTTTRVEYIDRPKTPFQKFKDWWFWISVAFVGGMAYFKIRKA